jgi:glycosyltransferase involved in cell wall biosynthesis
MRQRVFSKLGRRDQFSIDVIPNWADGRAIKPGSRTNWFSEKYGLTNSFVILFAGNFGLVNDFSTILDAARLLRESREIVFLFVGGGAKANEIRDAQLAQDLQNIRILPYHPPSDMSEILATAHASLVTLANGLAGLSVPSKTYWILASGRPVLFVGDTECEIFRVVLENKCGAAVPSGNSEELVAIISSWASDPNKLAGLGQTARTVFAEKFDRQRAVDSYIESFRKVLGIPEPSAPREPFQPNDQKTLKTSSS